MLPLALLPASVAVSIDGVVLDGDSVTLLLRTASAAASCPRCGQPSHHVHSRYARAVRDLPYQGRPTTLRLTARKFFCRNPDCPRAVFCERLPDLAPRHARCTPRLAESHRAIAFALGGEAGSRLAVRLGMPASPDTLLRRIKQTTTAGAPTPRVLGIDDWAIRRGHNYGTILVDLERGRVIDLLSGRDGAALRQWLKDHPGVEVVSRDRAGAYAQAASEAAPQALQVADRWHLLKNVREMLETFFERHRGKIRAVAALLAQPLTPTSNTPGQPKHQAASREEAEAAQSSPHPGRAAAEQGKRQQRVRRYQQVRERHGQGQSIRRIAQEMGLSRNSVRRHLRQDHCPDWRPGQARRTQVDGFQRWVDEQIRAGRDNAAELHRELTAKGFTGGYDAVRRFLTGRLAALGRTRQRRNAAQPGSPPAPSARSLAFDVLRAEEKRQAEDRARLGVLRGIDEEFRQTLALAEEFIALVRKERSEPLAGWLARAVGAASAELRGFAQGIQRDAQAVAAAISETWSNGPVEGAVNRLKTIKRQMYGRAGFDLLRRRVLHAS